MVSLTRARGRVLAALCGLAVASGGAIAAAIVRDPAGRPSAALARSRSTGARPAASAGPPRARYAVGVRVLTFIDRSRTVRFPGGRREPRTLVTVVRYPALGHPSPADLRTAAPARAGAPFPLIVFGHGFAVTPAVYWRLLHAWAAAGYVVAAPVFPLENAHAPGGPDEGDLIHQPRDLRVVITRMLAADADPRSPLAGLLARREIAVSGQSDGGITALAAAYDPYYRDARVRAAAVLSGAAILGAGRAGFAHPSPPLLAVQGTADTINRPQNTYAFFDAAPRPKYLLRLLGAPHLPPYTDMYPQLSIVERVAIAFFDRYLKRQPRGIARMAAAADQPGVARLELDG